jgi:ferric-dicitrate binding protein FerR (iron transport regulator)
MVVEGKPPLSAPTAGLVELARDSLGQMTEERRVAGLAALRARLASHRGVWTRRRSGLARVGALALAGCIGLTLLWLRHRGEHASPLVLRVEGAPLGDDGLVEAVGSGPVLRFSDGSAIDLAERTRVRVRSMDEHGAWLIIERGKAQVHVVHDRGTLWTFDAGPYVVAVTGTDFAISWREVARRLDVQLENGVLTVSGPASDAPLTLSAGQWLSARGGDVRIGSSSAPHDP